MLVVSSCAKYPRFGVFVDSTITYDKTSSDWPDWNTLLADSPILCADGEALTGRILWDVQDSVASHFVAPPIIQTMVVLRKAGQ